MKNKPDCLSDELLRILKMIWSVFFPLAAYYLISSMAMMILTLVVQDMAAVISKDGIGWSADNENAIQAVSNGIGMLIAAFCLRRPFLSEVVLQGEPVTIKPRRLFGSLIHEDGKRFRSQWKGMAAGAVLAVCASLSLNLLAELIRAVQYSRLYEETVQIQYAVSFAVGLLLYGVISPIAEEMLFRGILYGRCRRYLGVLPGILLSSILFAILHGNLVQGIYAFLMGMLICGIYERYHSFFASVIFHAAANVTAFSLSYFTVRTTTSCMVINCVIFAIISSAFVFFIFFRKKN